MLRALLVHADLIDRKAVDKVKGQLSVSHIIKGDSIGLQEGKLGGSKKSREPWERSEKKVVTHLWSLLFSRHTLVPNTSRL